MQRYLRLVLGLLLITALDPRSIGAAPLVVTSIKPLHDLASAVMAGVGEPVLLLKGNRSPHDFSLAPSQAASIGSADLLIWIGPSLEAPLTTSAGRLPDTRQLRLQNERDLLLLPRRNESRADHEEEGHHHDHHGETDPHLWLHPGNAIKIVELIRDRINRLDPENAALYHRNAEKTKTELNLLAAELRTRLAPNTNRSYLVFHDAFQYFELAFGLKRPFVYSISPEVQPGLRHVNVLRNLVDEGRVSACFVEPQFSPKILEAVTRGSDLKCNILDPIGTITSSGLEGYLALITGMADAFLAGMAHQ